MVELQGEQHTSNVRLIIIFGYRFCTFQLSRLSAVLQNYSTIESVNVGIGIGVEC